MTRRTLPYICVALITVIFVSAAFAMGGGNARKGKFLYRKNCRSCHGASASDLSPSTYTQAEWKAKFADPATLPCSKDWGEKVSDKDVNDIFTYLHDYAKDSPSPAKCS